MYPNQPELALSLSVAPHITVTGVRKSFGSIPALRNCSFNARAGEIHALLGANGSGKSTLVKLLGGVLQPDSGRLIVNGSQPSSPYSARRSGTEIVYQEILVAHHATIVDNVFLGRDSFWRSVYSHSTKIEIATRLLKQLTGEALNVNALIDTCSIGVQQAVVIARALVVQPHCLILDESTAALGRDEVERLFAIVRQLRDAGVCIVIITHRIEEILMLAEAVTILHDGVNMDPELRGDLICRDNLLSGMAGDGVVYNGT